MSTITTKLRIPSTFIGDIGFLQERIKFHLKEVGNMFVQKLNPKSISYDYGNEDDKKLFSRSIITIYIHCYIGQSVREYDLSEMIGEMECREINA